MAYKRNPFLERMSERTTSDQEFVRLFSPKILERLEPDTFEGAVHIFRSAPGGGKTTLFRAFSPSALRAFWSARMVDEMSEAYQNLLARGVFHEVDGPALLGVPLSCASGYSDLPPGAAIGDEGLLRALFNCRVVLRALRNLATLLGFSNLEQAVAEGLALEYEQSGADLRGVPAINSVAELARWAEKREKSIYSQLDALSARTLVEGPSDARFDGVLWLQSVRFVLGGRAVAPRRLLMVDDVQKLRRAQRRTLIEELIEMRPTFPVWLAERAAALGDELLAQGARSGRDLREHGLEEIWSASKFSGFAQSVLDRRLAAQTTIPAGSFAQYLREEPEPGEVAAATKRGREAYEKAVGRLRQEIRYIEWLARADAHAAGASVDSLLALYVTRILLSRNEAKPQLTLALEPLPTKTMEERESSQVQGAAEIFANDEAGLPYYMGMERLCAMATSNIEELLGLAGALYERLQAKQVLRKPELILPAQEQEKILKEVAKQKRDFIPKNHTHGLRAQRLLDSIGSYCRERTFLQNAPYAPGVSGVRLAVERFDEMASLGEAGGVLRRVLAECVAENLLVTRPSAASTSRSSGTVFYLNRTLCAHYGLPLQFGGWQDVTCKDLFDWMERGRRTISQRSLLEGI